MSATFDLLENLEIGLCVLEMYGFPISMNLISSYTQTKATSNLKIQSKILTAHAEYCSRKQKTYFKESLKKYFSQTDG